MICDRNVRPMLESLETRTLPAGVGLVASLLGPPANVSAQDQTFLINSTQGDVQEIMLGFLALQNGSSPGVKQFGITLMTDHTKSLLQVIPVLFQARMLPPLPSTQQISTVFQFASLKGSQFDQPFVNLMVTDHQQDIAAAQFQETHGTDPAAIDFAMMTLPVLQNHLNIALSLQQSPTGTTSGT
jgi:putative membrane protein